jgi:hypothetical protein
VIQTTGLLPPDDKAIEEGFFCYVTDVKSEIKHHSLCELIKKAATKWVAMSNSDRKPYRGERAAKCKEDMQTAFLTESCVRAYSREIAQNQTATALEDMVNSHYDSHNSYCLSMTMEEKRRPNFLSILDENTLAKEKAAYEDEKARGHGAISPYIENMLAKADRAMKLGKVYSVMDKILDPVATRTPIGLNVKGHKIYSNISKTHDRHYYYSLRPYFWPAELLVGNENFNKTGNVFAGEDGFVHLDGERCPGTIIGGT